MRGRQPPTALLAAFASTLFVPAVLAAPSSGTNQPQPKTSPVLETASLLPIRAHRQVTHQGAPQGRAIAWSRFVKSAGSQWQASWDQATRVPNRIFGKGIPAPGTVANPQLAATHAQKFLAAHIDLLAPGSSPSNFVMVANHLHDGIRSIGFRQQVNGMAVLGGQLSFRYKNDRLFVLSSQALPDVHVPLSSVSTSPDAARSFAKSWILTDRAGHASAGAVTGPFVLPLIGQSGVLGYRVVHRVEVAARAPIGRFEVFTDATTGAPIARKQTLHFADGLVRYNVPVRHPGAGRAAIAASDTRFTIGGEEVISGALGQVTWTGDSASTITMRVEGPLVRVNNDSGAEATEDRPIMPGNSLTWSATSDEQIEAQLTAFVHASVVKKYVRSFAGDLAWLDTQLPVNVNIDSECNAFSDGNSINFFQSSGECENTARLADVVYHEFGHSLHSNSVIEGVGSFDGAHSEGLSDYLAATITEDPGMGRGFFLDDGPLRHIDPLDRENVWPRDVGEVHFTGLIFAGAMWDLRKLMIDQYGQEEGVALADRLFYATLLRATDIPSTYIEILAADDDDGDLANGTPNICDINAAFGAHGLRSLSAELEPLAAEMAGEDGFPVAMRVTGLSAQCPGDGLAAATLNWYQRNTSIDDAADVTMVRSEEEPSLWTANIPAVDEGSVVRFKILVDFEDGSFRSFPNNPADPRYEFYVGEVIPLYCTDFETNPFEEGWTHTLVEGTDEQGADDWTWGPPMAAPQSGDPPAAFSGESVVGTDLGGEEFNGKYQADKRTFAQTPRIDVGAYSDVRLQYWRWLTVEDAFFDQASIYANNQVAWRNFNSENGNQSATQHTDHEWRFHDVPISEFIRDGSVDLRFELASDGGLEFGGWTMDDFCIVAAAGSICGDGVLSGAEECDDGNLNSDDEGASCRSSCRAPACGDGIVDNGESCDDGNNVDGDGCNALCGGGDEDTGDCGCTVAPREGGPGTGTLLLIAFTLLAVVRPRRRLRAFLSR